MHITLYHRSYPVQGAPESVSLAPFPAHQRHTYTAEGVVYEAVYRELRVTTPDGATVGGERLRLKWGASSEPVLSWAGEKGPAVSTAKEVLELASTRGSGFRLMK
jgi:hypothetical protein